MKKTFIIPIILLVVAAACSPTQSPVPVFIDEVQPPAAATPLESATQVPPPEEPSVVPPAPVISGGLWLQVLSPVDEAVLDTPQADVIGSAPAGTVISVNDEIVVVGENGQFEITLLLDEGPNLIEIVASDIDGSEITQFLTIVYEP